MALFQVYAIGGDAVARFGNDAQLGNSVAALLFDNIRFTGDALTVNVITVTRMWAVLFITWLPYGRVELSTLVRKVAGVSYLGMEHENKAADGMVRFMGLPPGGSCR